MALSKRLEQIRSSSRPPRRAQLLLAGAAAILVAQGCAGGMKSQHLERIPLESRACWDAPSCFEVLERSSDSRALERAEEQLGRVGPPAIPRLAWLVRHGDRTAQVHAAGALGGIAATHPQEVQAAGVEPLRGLCSDSSWTACWTLAQSGDRSSYPLFIRHLRRYGDAVFEGRPLRAEVAEWFISELERPHARAVFFSTIVPILLEADGPLSLAALERVRTLLAAELPHGFRRTPGGYPCQSHGDDCWSRLDYLVAAIGAWGPRAAPAQDEVRKIWREAPPRHSAIARTTLAKMGDRSLVPVLLSELPAWRRATLDDLALLGKAARPELPQLIALMQASPGVERSALFRVIVAIGGPLAIQAALDGLDNHVDDAFVALRGLRAASQEEGADLASIRAARPRIEALYLESSFVVTRSSALVLLETLGFEPPAEVPLPCPPVVGAESPKRPGQISPQARVAGKTVVFMPIGESLDEECAHADWSTLRVGGECLRAGPAITVHDAATGQAMGAVRGVGMSPMGFLRQGDHILLVEGFMHIWKFGSVDRLTRDAGGHWQAHKFADLPGYPLGYARDQSGQVLLLVSATIGLCGAENGGYQVLRLGKEGGTEALR
jgi:hypothetical protein